MYHIILFDQRGCGLSQPFGELEGNNTQNLIADMERMAAWLQSVKSPVQKPLTEMSRYQLSKTITALENMVTKKY